MGLFDGFKKKRRTLLDNVNDVIDKGGQNTNTPLMCYKMAYVVLPQELYKDPTATLDRIRSLPDTAGELFYTKACISSGCIPKRQDLTGFRTHMGRLSPNQAYVIIEYPSPPPPRFDTGIPVLAPYFSGAIVNETTGQPAYFVLGQDLLGGTTLRAVNERVDANMGPGSEPTLDAFLQLLRSIVKFEKFARKGETTEYKENIESNFETKGIPDHNKEPKNEDIDAIVENLLILASNTKGKSMILGISKPGDEVIMHFLKKYNSSLGNFNFIENILRFVNVYIALKVFLDLADKELENKILEKFPDPNNFVKVYGYAQITNDWFNFAKNSIQYFIKDLNILDNSWLSQELVAIISGKFMFLLSGCKIKDDSDLQARLIFNIAITGDLNSLPEAITHFKEKLDLR